MKRQLNIVSSNFDYNINDLLSITIEKVVRKEYHLNVASISYMEDIEGYARRNPIELFVIVVNNVHFYENPLENQVIKKTLQFIREMKDAHNRPVTALCGWPDDPHFSEKVIQASANF